MHLENAWISLWKRCRNPVRNQERVTDVFLIASYDATESYAEAKVLPDYKTWWSQTFKCFKYTISIQPVCFQSRLSVQYDDSPYLCSRSSTVSSPRFSSSFHAKEIVYPSHKVGSHHIRPASEQKYRSPEARRKQSAWSLGASGDQSCYKTFQDPVQKTYSGDLLQKHSQRFTQDKPFTPKTLKSEKSSYMSQYR